MSLRLPPYSSSNSITSSQAFDNLLKAKPEQWYLISNFYLEVAEQRKKCTTENSKELMHYVTKGQVVNGVLASEISNPMLLSIIVGIANFKNCSHQSKIDAPTFARESEMVDIEKQLHDQDYMDSISSEAELKIKRQFCILKIQKLVTDSLTGVSTQDLKQIMEFLICKYNETTSDSACTSINQLMYKIQAAVSHTS